MQLVTVQGVSNPFQSFAHRCHCLPTAVNYAPTFTPGPSPISVAEGSGSFSAAWATTISAGPGDDEELRLAIDCDDAAAALFAAGPAISSGGVLSFTPAAHKSGSSRCSVSLVEAGSSGLSANASLVIVITAGAAWDRVCSCCNSSCGFFPSSSSVVCA
jgi:hypothetical protein